MNKLSVRQLCLLLLCVLPAGKVLLLPSLLSREAGGDLLLPAVMNFAVQALLIFLILWLSERTQCTFFELVRNTFGKTTEKVVAVAFALFFLFFALMPLLEHKAYVQSAFYDSIPALLVFMPFFLFSAFACTKNITAIGRSADMSLVLFALPFLALLFMAISSSDFTSILPFGEFPFFQSLKASAYTLNWFSDSAFTLMMMGHYKADRKTTVKATLSYIGGALVILFFLALFYGIFQSLAPRETYAVTKIARYYGGLQVLGRVDYLFIYILAIPVIFYTVLPLQMACQCLCEVFGDHRSLYSLIVNGAMAAFVYFFNYYIIVVYNVTNKILFPVFLFFAYIIPVVALFLRRKAVEKK